MKGPDLHRLQALRSRVFVVHVLDDGAYMNSRLVGDKYLALIRQVVDKDIASVRFIVLGEVHPDIAGIIPAEALVRARPLSSRGGSVDPKVVEPRQPVVGALTCVDGRQYRNVLLPNGDVTLCCMDFEPRHVLGNLLRDGYEDLFEGPVFSEIIDRMNGTDGFLLCRMCEYAIQRRPHADWRSANRLKARERMSILLRLPKAGLAWTRSMESSRLFLRGFDRSSGGISQHKVV